MRREGDSQQNSTLKAGFIGRHSRKKHSSHSLRQEGRRRLNHTAKEGGSLRLLDQMDEGEEGGRREKPVTHVCVCLADFYCFPIREREREKESLLMLMMAR